MSRNTSVGSVSVSVRALWPLEVEPGEHRKTKEKHTILAPLLLVSLCQVMNVQGAASDVWSPTCSTRRQWQTGPEGKTLQSGKLLINAFPLLAVDVSK